MNTSTGVGRPGEPAMGRPCRATQVCVRTCEMRLGHRQQVPSAIASVAEGAVAAANRAAERRAAARARSLAPRAGREPAPEELAAADIVAGALGGRWKSSDGEDDPPEMHDFDVILPDGRCVALEVTSAIDGAAVALSDAAFGREGREQRWPAPGLANDWIVTIPQRPVRVVE